MWVDRGLIVAASMCVLQEVAVAWHQHHRHHHQEGPAGAVFTVTDVLCVHGTRSLVWCAFCPTCVGES